MGRLVVTEFISLDGVMEDPGGAESFEHGGWTFTFDFGEAERAYDRAGPEEAEERYGAYLELVEEASDALREIRETYASTLEPDQAEAYEEAFDSEVSRRMPPFGLSL